MSREEKKLPKVAYRVTWPGRKNLGAGGTFPACVGAQKHFKLQNEGFQNEPQISFWPIGGRGRVGARQKYDQKKLQTLEMLFDTGDAFDTLESAFFFQER